MNQNDKIFVESIVNYEKNIANAQSYIKENYNVDSNFDSDNFILYLWCNDVNESLNVVAAKEYILNSDLNVEIKFGKQ